MKTATLIKKIEGWSGDARKYLLSEPHDGHDVVIVSAANAFGSGPETYIFPGKADSDEPASWSEMEGSFRGGLSHSEALGNVGYEIVEN